MKILLSNNLIDRQLAHQSFDGKFLKNSKTDHEHIPLVEVIPPTKEQLPKKSLKAKLERYNSTLDEVLSCFRSHPLLMYFNHGNERSISRILLSTQFALRLRHSKHFRTVNQVVKIETLAAWITLVDQWPYRVSWIWQAIEDNVQQSNLDPL
uniref:Uncharacterized protein n=1 Tax=Ciona savignyi TaxID=51511 RepID=H2Z442_CIOSA